MYTSIISLIVSLIVLCIIFYIILIIKKKINNNNKEQNNLPNTDITIPIVDPSEPIESQESIEMSEEQNNIDNFKVLKNNDNIKMVIFVATWCGACNSYKNNIHNDLSKELENVYKNIKFEFIVDDPENENIKNLQKYFEIKYFPTIILYKNDKYKKLPMTEQITKENIIKLVNEIKE